MNASKAEITLIGRDPSLTYLLRRFAEQSGYRVAAVDVIPTAEQIRARKPALVLFASMESLAMAQDLVNELANGDIPVGVCAAVGDEPRARELGADQCFFHPLTYDQFLAALSDAEAANRNRFLRDSSETHPR